MPTRFVKRFTSGPVLRFVCLPYGGGSAWAFRPLAQKLPPEWEIVSADPPGHGTNSEPFVEGFEALVDFYEAAFADFLAPPFVLYGHSMGGLAAYRLTQRLEKKGTSPLLLLISGALPPRLQELEKEHWHEMADEEIVRDLTGMQGLGPELLGSEGFLEYLLPIVRADSLILSTFRRVDESPVRTPTWVFGGEEDHDIPEDRIVGWEEVGPSVQIEMMKGPHMFVHTQENELARRIRSRVENVLSFG